MKQKTEIINVAEDVGDGLMMTLDYLYTPSQNEFKHVWYDGAVKHEQTYWVVGVEDEIEALIVTRKVYVIPHNR